ncbi:MAG TPA: phosphoribosylamine--glycine ligase [Firmicutes bacterium]|nr:phosphoribosylamine--glycine ligase [Candidatus Fermentithermobacillaceae bacterium]
MNVLVTGSGAREHALVWRIALSPSVKRVFAAPGNPGTAAMTDVARNVPLNPNPEAFEETARFCRQNDIELVVVGPENHLAAGLADYLRDMGIHVFGPGKRGTMLEASKAYGMDFARRYSIPHPRFESFETCDAALRYVEKTQGPWVIKTDGLALGKGVTIARDRGEALRTVREYMAEGAYGEAGRRIVFQEFLEGREVTAMALTDGDYMIPLPLARDHKRVGEGDLGPMTGGMGAFSPVDLTGEGSGLEDRIREEVLERAVAGLKSEGIDFRGLLYAGLMITKDGPKILEFNVRFGDPETQCVLPRIEGDFAGVLMACAGGRLRRYVEESSSAGGVPLSVRREACVTVVMASGGYPGAYRKGIPISGLDDTGLDIQGAVSGPEGRRQGEDRRQGEGEVLVFHAGTKTQDGALVTSGGRVLSVTALASSLDVALGLAYRKVESIRFDGAFYRRDIGK